MPPRSMRCAQERLLNQAWIKIPNLDNPLASHILNQGDGGGVERKYLALPSRKPNGTRAQNTDDVAMGNSHDEPVTLSHLPQEGLGPYTNLLDRLSSRAAVSPDIPTGTQILDLRRR